MIDVSEFQGLIAWGAMPKATRALIRVSYGSSGVDKGGARNVSAALSAGLRVGPYHFLEDADPEAEIAHFFGCMNGRLHDFELRGMIDVEPSEFSHPSSSHVQAAIDAYHTRADYWPTVYGNTGVLAALNLPAKYAACPLIVADYGPNDGREHPLSVGIPRPWSRLDAHQYTSVGHYPGIGGNVDRNAVRPRHRLDIPRPRFVIDKFKVSYVPKRGPRTAKWTLSPYLFAKVRRAERRGRVTIYPHRKEV